MKRFLTAAVSAAVLVIGGSAATVSAQVGDPDISIDNAEPGPGEAISVTVGNLEEGTTVSVTLEGSSAEGVADADGTAVVQVNAPDAAGAYVGMVSVGGVDFSFDVVVVETDGGTDTTAPADTTAPTDTTAPADTTAPTDTTAPADTTPQPSVVDTGDGLGSSDNSVALYAAALGLLLVGGGVFIARRRSL